MKDDGTDSGASDDYDLVDAPAHKVAINANPKKERAVLAYRTPAVVPVEGAKPRAEPEAIRNVYMPMWLLGGGVLIKMVAGYSMSSGFRNALLDVGVELVLGTLVMLVGIYIAAKARAIDLGPMGVAIFKLSAICVAPGAVVLLGYPIWHLLPLGWLIAWVCEFVLYFTLLGVLFELDESDTWYCVSVIFVIRLAVYFTLVWLVASR